MSLESSILYFERIRKSDFKFYGYYDKSEKKVWKASCQFDVKIHLDPTLSDLERASIEYRQYIRGGAWVIRGNEGWSDNSHPNANTKFAIPPYAGQNLVSELPASPVPGDGLSLHWKEDGEIQAGLPESQRYGYRDTIPGDDFENEKDIWTPSGSLGLNYHLRDTPSVGGDWGDRGESATVWIELWFIGAIVEVDRGGPNDTTRPIRVLRKKTWEYFFQNKKMDSWQFPNGQPAAVPT